MDVEHMQGVSPLLKNSELSTSSINESMVKCIHNKNGKICDECSQYEKEKQITKEKLSECIIF